MQRPVFLNQNTKNSLSLFMGYDVPHTPLAWSMRVLYPPQPLAQVRGSGCDLILFMRVVSDFCDLLNIQNARWQYYAKPWTDSSLFTVPRFAKDNLCRAVL